MVPHILNWKWRWWAVIGAWTGTGTNTVQFEKRAPVVKSINEKRMQEPSFLEILASTYGPGPYAPGPYTPGSYALGPWIIWSNVLSQICSRSIVWVYTAPHMNFLWTLQCIDLGFPIFVSQTVKNSHKNDTFFTYFNQRLAGTEPISRAITSL